MRDGDGADRHRRRHRHEPADDYVADFVAGISRLKVVHAHAVMQPLDAYIAAHGKLVNPTSPRVNGGRDPEQPDQTWQSTMTARSWWRSRQGHGRDHPRRIFCAPSSKGRRCHEQARAGNPLEATMQRSGPCLCEGTARPSDASCAPARTTTSASSTRSARARASRRPSTCWPVCSVPSGLPRGGCGTGRCRS
jgi:hypothetical protein